MTIPYLIQGSNITVVIDNKPHTISKSHVSYDRVRDAIKRSDWDTVRKCIDTRTEIVNYGNGFITIKNNVLYWKDTVMHNALTVRMIEMLKENFPITPLVKFMENLMQNPSHRSVSELYGFLEKNNLPITPDGHFLAYKKVRGDYKDVHSGKFDNSVGKVCEMERNQVDDKAENTCSTGLHFCSHDYLKHFGGERVMIVKINPRDVVSIPVDYNNAKGRCSRYVVVGEVGKDVGVNDEFTKPIQENAKSVQTTFPKLPRKGTSAFFKGYEAGFSNTGYDNSECDPWGIEIERYDEGYDRGVFDRTRSNEKRYEYVEPTVAPVTKTWRGFWPVAKK